MSKSASLPQAKEVLNLLDSKGITAQRLQDLFDTKLLSMLLDVDPKKVDVEAFRAVLAPAMLPKTKKVAVPPQRPELRGAKKNLTVVSGPTEVETLRAFARDQRLMTNIKELLVSLPMQAERKVTIFHMTWAMRGGAIIKWLEAEDCKPATVWDLSALALSHPTAVEPGVKVLALGSPLELSGTSLYFTLSLDHQNEFRIDLEEEGGPWSADHVILGVQLPRERS